MSRPRPSFLLTTLLAAALAAPAQAAVLAVTEATDTLDGTCDSDCSLRDAVVAANTRPGRDVVVLPPGFYRLTRAGAGEDLALSGDLDVRQPLTVVGAGADKTFVDGGGLDRVFDALGVNLELLALTVQGGRVQGWGGGLRATGDLGVYRTLVRGSAALGRDGMGGGLFVRGNLVMHESTVAENVAEGYGGGGIYADGDVLINNSTISGNRAMGDAEPDDVFFYEGLGGALLTDTFGGDVIVSNSTITGNAALTGGGLVSFAGGDYPSSFPALPPGIGLRNSLIAGNTAAGGGPDCIGEFTSDGYNLIGDASFCELDAVATGNLIGTGANPIDPRLGSLGFHGGPTPTHALLPGSPALDAGSPKQSEVGTAWCQANDQRGQARAVDGNGDGTPRCDIGAVEQSTACISGGGTLCLQGGRFRLTSLWETGAGAAGAGQSLGLTPDSGSFWFFDPGNIEVTVKVLDACALNGRYWVFASGLTNLEVQLAVTDTATGATKTYASAQGTVFAPILDTAAFDCE